MSSIDESQTSNLPVDPDNAGWVLGWAAVRQEPWSFGGIYEFKGQAQQKAASLGAEYEVKYGSHRLGSDAFISCPQPNLGIDAELFQFMLEHSFSGFWVPVVDIKTHLEEKLDREVTVHEIAKTVETTQYTQRDFQGRRTNILPYDTGLQNGTLHQIRMPDHVAKNTTQWGW